MEVQIQYLNSGAKMPVYATPGSAGMDLSAAIEEPVVMLPGTRRLIPTGIALGIPSGYGGFIFPRSGLSYKKGITMCNSVGVIDSDYTGEIQIAVYNIAKEPVTIAPGDRIAQLVFLSVAQATLVECERLEDTQRGSGGFGSTGVK